MTVNTARANICWVLAICGHSFESFTAADSFNPHDN